MRRLMIYVALLLLSSSHAQSCTAFCAAARGLVLVGNNEDYSNPFTKIWFVPAEKGAYGRVYVGFDDFFPQGGMNERGVFFDGLATERVAAAGSAGKDFFPGNLADRAMAECATVQEVVALFEKYNRSFLERGVLFFARRPSRRHSTRILHRFPPYDHQKYDPDKPTVKSFFAYFA